MKSSTKFSLYPHIDSQLIIDRLFINSSLRLLMFS
ncbi:unnamed protein product [Schistosoma curassoni]|uniref:Uncharacterized protein n=1 Tax=Schistosoma curassoni TaxID=6186 RepID=A0A183K9H8_9TREM|nr:unnamed protein product [Schistosoma curassoni]